jgi:hypothetical protein
MFVTKRWLKKQLNAMLGKPHDTLLKLLIEAKERIGPAEEVSKLKRELAELELKKVMEQREIEHLVKLKQEKLEIEHQKREVVLQKEFQQKEMKMQTEYHGRIMTAIEAARKEQQETYKEIMKRLPNVNVRLGDGK